MFKSEDWWAVWLGLFIFLLSMGPVFWIELLGWMVKFNVWVESSKALAPVSKSFQSLPGIYSALLTYLFLMGITTVEYMVGFRIIYWLTFVCMILGTNGYIAATPDKLKSLKIPWSMSLGDMGFVLAMIAGLVIGEFFQGFAKFLEEAAKPEWFIKTGIVILGAAIGIKTVGALGLANTVIIRGFCAVIEAYLIYWSYLFYRTKIFLIYTGMGRTLGVWCFHLWGFSSHRYSGCNSSSSNSTSYFVCCHYCICGR